mmetsp:Transcript_3506/g.7216  ORF Transcript_3506/g.7216 Transcript_3506/m.7216 type:complete len:291 (+) Transcript_3506:99-971(+)
MHHAAHHAVVLLHLCLYPLHLRVRFHARDDVLHLLLVLGVLCKVLGQSVRLRPLEELLLLPAAIVGGGRRRLFSRELLHGGLLGMELSLEPLGLVGRLDLGLGRFLALLLVVLRHRQRSMQVMVLGLQLLHQLHSLLDRLRVLALHVLGLVLLLGGVLGLLLALAELRLHPVRLLLRIRRGLGRLLVDLLVMLGRVQLLALVRLLHCLDQQLPRVLDRLLVVLRLLHRVASAGLILLPRVGGLVEDVGDALGLDRISLGVQKLPHRFHPIVVAHALLSDDARNLADHLFP